MNNLFNITVSIVFSLLLLSCADEKPQHLKVLAWNIWHEGHQKAYSEKGCEGVIGLIKETEADVVLIIETYGSSNKIADSLGYYHRLISSNLSIYSRFPIKKTLTFPDSISTFNFGGVEIDFNGKTVRLFDTWLHYLPDARVAPLNLTEKEIIEWEKSGSRDEEIRKILSVLKPLLDDKIPLIMGGDFNSHSHLDWTESTKDMYNHGGAVVNWPVSKKIIDGGFKDSFREIYPDPVKEIGTTWLEPDSANLPVRADRIDYIYYTGNNIKAIESSVYDTDHGRNLLFNGKEFLYASDHGFVLSTFQID